MKNKIVSAIMEIKKAGARKISAGTAEYYAPFEEIYINDRENFCAALAEIHNDAQTDAEILLHAMRLSAYFGVKTENLAAELRAFFEKCFALMNSGDVWESRDGLFFMMKADELLKSFAVGAERNFFENFITLADVNNIQTAGLYDLCAELRLVKPTPKYIKDAMRASRIIDGLYGTVPLQYYLEHTSLAKIERDTAVLEKVGFVKISQMIGNILAEMKEANIDSRKKKERFCEKICLKNKEQIKKIMEEEKNNIDEYIASHNNY